jgi:hypothetical protein
MKPTRKEVLDMARLLGIDTKGKAKQKLLTEIWDCFDNTAAYTEPNKLHTYVSGYEIRPADETVDKYGIWFSMDGYITVKADSEAVACKYVKDELERYLNPCQVYEYVNVELHDFNIMQCTKLPKPKKVKVKD